MLKKVQISKTEGKSSAILETVRCSICDRVSVNSKLRDCDSGLVVSKSCQRNLYQSDLITRRKSGDCITGLDQVNMRASRYDPSSPRNKTLASGDHCHCSKCFRAMPKSKSLNTIDMNEKPNNSRFSLPEGVKGMYIKTTEATIKYKNVNFRESDSLLSIPGINEDKTIKHDPEKVVDIIHRPIMCPVTVCRKIIARTSVLQHFIFDHSKIPRITLNLSELYTAFINISVITKETSCYAVLLMKTVAPLVHTVGLDTLMNGGYKNASFLLMGVRMQCAETIKKPHKSKCVSIRHAQTQTEARMRSSKVNLDAETTENQIDRRVHKYFGNRLDTIMLWICNLGDSIFHYNISIKRPDKKLGYSFTGETLNISVLHNLLEMYNEVECLRILEISSMKLVNEHNELEVTVNIFN